MIEYHDSIWHSYGSIVAQYLYNASLLYTVYFTKHVDIYNYVFFYIVIIEKIIKIICKLELKISINCYEKLNRNYYNIRARIFDLIFSDDRKKL